MQGHGDLDVESHLEYLVAYSKTLGRGGTVPDSAPSASRCVSLPPNPTTEQQMSISEIQHATWKTLTVTCLNPRPVSPDPRFLQGCHPLIKRSYAYRVAFSGSSDVNHSPITGPYPAEERPCAPDCPISNGSSPEVLVLSEDGRPG